MGEDLARIREAFPGTVDEPEQLEIDRLRREVAARAERDILKKAAATSQGVA